MSRPATVPRGRHAPPPEIRQGQQRDRLFAAAAAVFSRVGHADASAEAIAREAGMSKATFYEHFDNKDHCLLALVEAAHEGALAELERIRATHAELDKDECVFATVRDFLRLLDAFPEQTRTVLSVAAGAGPRARARRDAIFDGISAYIHESFESVRSFEDAYAIVTAGFGLVERRLRTGEPRELDALDPVITRFALAVVGSRGVAGGTPVTSR